MEKIEHSTVYVNGINIHFASIGEGPVVLFLHGFPELWYSWRHQLLSLSSLGYRSIAPDLRGFGDSDAPPSHTSYTAFHVVGDLVGLIDHLSIDQVFLVGHDWGAIIAWYFCSFRPDRVKALVNLSVQFIPRNPAFKIVEGFRAALGDDFYICRFQPCSKNNIIQYCPLSYFCAFRPDRVKALVNLSVQFMPRNPAVKFVEGLRGVLGHDFYICKFQEPGEAEEDFGSIPTTHLFKKILLSRSARPPIIPKEIGFRGRPTPDSLPSWLSEDDINYFAGKYDKSGFTGGLNYYRAMDLTWELTAPWTGAQIKVPAKFIIGDQDLTYYFPGVKDYIHKGGLKKDVPNLEQVVVIEGASHFINQEKPEEISSHIYEFIKNF